MRFRIKPAEESDESRRTDSLWVKELHSAYSKLI